MRILIVNQPLNNRGDESAHKGLVRKILADVPDAEVRVLFVGSGYNPVVEQYEVKSPRTKYVQIRQIKAYTAYYRKCLQKGWYRAMLLHPIVVDVYMQYKWADCIVCAPGGIDMGGFQSWQHLFYLKLAQLAKKPLAYYGRSFGPFPTDTAAQKRFKEISMEMLRYFSYCSIRDKKTAKLADELHVPYMLTVDSAFLDTPDVEIPQEVRELIGEKPYMVFVPNALNWHFAYRELSDEQVMDFFCKVATTVMAHNPELNIVMLPQLFGYGAGDDVHFFRQLAEQMNDPRIIVVPDCYSSDVQQMVIKGAQYLIGARYHSVVFALNQAVPFVALNYEHKIAGLLETLGKDDCMVDITKSLFTEDGVADTIAQVAECLGTIKADENARAQAKAIANKCFKEFKKTIHE